MKEFLKQIIFLGYLSNVISQEQKLEERDIIGCQQKSTSGRSYEGGANTTVDGIPCQKWSKTHPHNHNFTHVGDHNFCRNPDGAIESQVWCYTTDPEQERQNCLVPFCPPLKALDFSLDDDLKPSKVKKNNTIASLQKKIFPPSFTICISFMVEAWFKETPGRKKERNHTVAPLFVLLDGKGKTWLYVTIYAFDTFTEYRFGFGTSPEWSTGQSEILFFPLQWTRVCLSMESSTSLVRLVVDGELLVETTLNVEGRPDNLNLVVGMKGKRRHPGQITNLNIFSSALPVEQMELQTSAGHKECGLEGDFLSWEKSLEEEQWTLYSKARWIDLDGGLEGP